MSRTKNIAIIFAGGVGQRFGAQLPKQFVVAYEKPIIIHTLEVFQNNDEIDEIYVGIVEEWLPFFEKLVELYGISKIPKNGIIKGGSNGQDTIYKILKQASLNNSDDSIVLINDGVRPIITEREIHENIEAVKKYGSAITCIPFSETPVYSNDGEYIDATLNREKLFRGVAPQSFRLGHIICAHEKIRAMDPLYLNTYNNGLVNFNIVDSASLVMAAFNEKCAIVKGNSDNMKVTESNDFSRFISIKVWSEILNFINVQKNQPFVPNISMLEAQRLEQLRLEAEISELGTAKNEPKKKVLKNGDNNDN